MEIIQGMYGLPQVGIIANNLIAKRLSNHGYYQFKNTPGLLRYIILVVENFGIVFFRCEHADNLMIALKIYYEKPQ